MDFAFNHDQQLLKNSARAFLDEHCKPSVVRALWDDPRGESEAMWKDMAQLGWLGLPLPEAYGGSGLGMVETAIVLEEMGRVVCPSPYFPTLLTAAALADAGSGALKNRWLPAIATGSARATVAWLDAEWNWEPTATVTAAVPTTTGWTLTGTKRFVPWAHVADVLLVPARAPEGLALFLVESSAPGLTLAPVTGMDLGTRWTSITLERVPVSAEARLGAGDQAPVLERLLRRGAVGAAAEMLGAARRCLDMSVGYAKVREQFGQPIGSFQAIRHKCAEMLLKVENAFAATYYAAWALDAGAEDAALAASVAKAYVSDAAREVCGDAIQVHGGIGFTWEYDLHLYFKRAKALEPMFGDPDYHRELIVRHVAK
jgi:alkylation response protein AidB-like acyl-CoA dehydrogenase